VKFSFEKRVFSSKYHGRHTFCCFAQQKSAIFFLLIFADFAEFQQTAKLLMKTLILPHYFTMVSPLERQLNKLFWD
jgi:hypothetical protein